MSYRALLFCPDEKTARTVTQVLGELEFSVEACLEPFAAVKKLMGEHFDAVVVDCDNEQNATLLFKSARNSTSNQASLAVAVVEGQAGVAKAFRIGANLVLTKPINIEQSKGTLRVARGLLRKGDPAKPASSAATAPAATATAVKPAAPKPVAPLKSAGPAPAAAVSTPRPAAPVAKPAAPPARAAVASSAAPTPKVSSSLPEISAIEPVAPAPAPRPILGSQAASTDVTSGFTNAPSAASFSSGAASAPAPAREVSLFRTEEVAPASAPKEADSLFETPAETAATESTSSHAASTSFTFGGANLPAESSGGSKKILFGVAAAVIVAGLLYAGWSYFQGRSSQPVSVAPSTAPAIAPAPVANPVAAAPKPAAATTTSAAPTSALPPDSQPAVQAQVDDTTVNSGAESVDPGTKNSAASASKASGSSPAAKTGAKSDASPMVVKGGSAPAIHTKPATPDAVAPSLIGMATPGSSAPPPNLVGGTANAPAPVLQTLNISQGVSQGLVIKKVQPNYPRNALTMHVEGAVELLATISTTGGITAVKVVSGDSMLTKAAADAVKQWKYKPYLLNGQPVEIQTQITVNFKLPH